MKATHKTALQSALLLCQKDICHELSSRKKRIIFMKKNIFFMKRNNYFHEKNSAMTLLDRKNKDKLQGRTSTSI